MNLSGQKILITGASRGIGKACAERCAVEGARIVLVARNQETLNSVRDALPGEGHIAIPADLLKPESCISEIFKQACADGIKLTGFVHAAGIGPAIPIKMVTLQALQEIFTVNYFSFMMMVRQFIQKKNCEKGCIVAISSVAAVAGWPGVSAYAGSKGALSASVRALAMELAPRIRVNSIMPSNIKTDMLFQTVSLDQENMQDKIKQQQPLGLGTPEDIAGMVSFLLGDDSQFITGGAFSVDGGYTAK